MGENSTSVDLPPLDIMNDFTKSSDINAVELCNAMCSNPSFTV